MQSADKRILIVKAMVHRWMMVMWGRNGNLQVITCCSKCQSHWNIAAPLRNYPHHSNRIYTSKWQKIDLGGQFLALLRCKSLSVVIMHCFYPCL